MSELPMHPMWWGDFFADPKVAALPGETQGVYVLLLGRMWMNGGWLANDDALIARLLGLSKLTWMRRHRPLIEPLLTVRVFRGVTGGLLTQKRIERDWRKVGEQIVKTNGILAKARAAKAAKSTRMASVADEINHAEPDAGVEPAAAPVSPSAAALNHNQIREEGRASEPSASAAQRGPASPVGSLRSGPVDVGAPSDPALVSRLVSDGLKRSTGTSLFERLGMKEDD